MRAITIPEFGDEDVLTVSEVPDLTPGPGEVLIEVAAAGVNRADLMQRQGFYPPPPGISEVPGLEVSGTITAVGEAAAGWVIGDEVCALLAGGGYAQQVIVPAGQVLPVPTGVSLQDAAALPEVACTVWSNIVMTAHLRTGDLFLQHGGSSGVGTMAIQIAKQLGARIAVTAGSQEKLEACAALGADILINYREQDFVEVIQEAGGADVILDVIGAKYLSRNVTALADGGRLVIIGLQGGTKAELDINQLLVKRGTVAATSLRSRSLAQKAAIVGEVREHVWPLIAQGKIRPIVSETFPLEDAARAHRALQESQHIGKILLTV